MKRMIVANNNIGDNSGFEIGDTCNLKYIEKSGEQAYAEVVKVSPRKYQSTTYGWVFRLDSNGDVFKEGKKVGSEGRIYC